jgi:hypothetical protein
MRKVTIAALLATQLAPAAQPAFAADFAATQEQRAGAFAGLRLRVPLDGARQQRQVRAGLAFAPTLHGHGGDGSVRMRIGEGVEFGYRSGRPLSWSIAGRDLGRHRLGAAEEGGHRGGMSVGKVALIVGGVLVLAIGVTTIVLIDEINDSSD